MSTHLLSQWFDHWDHPAMIVLQDLTLVTANIAAQNALDDCGTVRISDGKISLRQAGQTDSLRNALQSMDSGTRLWAGRRDDHTLDIIKIKALPSDKQIDEYYGLTFMPNALANRRHWGNLASAFLLTSAEERIAKHLFEGLSLAELSNELNITVETARTHIRRIYQKAGVTSREKLYTVLEPYQTL